MSLRGGICGGRAAAASALAAVGMIVAVICITMHGSSPVVLRLEPSVPVGTPCHPLVAYLSSPLLPQIPPSAMAQHAQRKTRDRLKGHRVTLFSPALAAHAQVATGHGFMPVNKAKPPPYHMGGTHWIYERDYGHGRCGHPQSRGICIVCCRLLDEWRYVTQSAFFGLYLHF